MIQDKDDGILTNDNFKIVTRKKPTDREIKDLKFAWIVAKHTKSNTIIFFLKIHLQLELALDK